MKKHGMGRAILGSLALTLVSLAGCGGASYDGPPRAEVFGAVTWNGEPVDGGTINFFPATSGGRTAGATIEQGKYRLEEAMGPEMGEYNVMINWGVKKNPDNLDDPLIEQIPPEYNKATTLKATISESPQEVSFALPQ
ncbi:MAG TPA: hypothetical protein VGN57_15835 [Pirellulaceae bacterium]|jgi:hypothetical protein|nr:hypothetical protein [Pirellulaceae bacterium]